MEKYIPEETVFQISEVCPRSLLAYILCVRCADDDYFALMTRELIDDKSLSWTRFKNDVKALARLGFVEWREVADGIAISVTPDYL
jgi:hypothetical protein